MRDGSTRKIDLAAVPGSGLAAFQRDWQVSLVLVSGGSAGTEFVLDGPAHVLGRGATADLRFADPALSSEHVSFEFVDTGYRLRDLGSMNGTLLNGSEVKVAELKNGDEVRAGTLVFRFVQDERSRGPRTYQVPVE